MAPIMQAQKAPSSVVRDVEGMRFVESNRVGVANLSPKTKEDISVLLGMHSKMLSRLSGFAGSLAPAGMGLSAVMKSVGSLVRLL